MAENKAIWVRAPEDFQRSYERAAGCRSHLLSQGPPLMNLDPFHLPPTEPLWRKDLTRQLERPCSAQFTAFANAVSQAAIRLSIT